jgi:hypothetical protein
MPTQNSLNFGTGTTGQVLTSNGVGVAPTFQAFSSLTKVVIQVFTSTGTYTPTTGMKYCIVECIAGGGGGGGVAASASLNGAGGGGGGGAYRRAVISAATIGASQAVTIGAAGAGGSTSGGNGTAGTTTILGTLVGASGGQAGTGVSAPAASGRANGGGGGGSGGGSASPIFTGEGSRVQDSFYISTLAISGIGWSSTGGGSVSGIALVAAGAKAGNNATSYGAPGSGAALLATNTGVAGGAGFSGLMIITEFC